MTPAETEHEEEAVDADDGPDLDDLADRAEEAMEGLRESVDDPDAGLGEIVDRLDEGAGEETSEHLDELLAVTDEIEDVLETIDLSELPDAIDFEELPELIETDELPEAIEEGEADEVIKLRKLASVIDFTELWDATDVRAFWQAKRELDDAVEDVTDGEEGEDEGGLLDELTGSEDDDEGMLDDLTDSEDDDDGMLDELTGEGEMMDDIDAGDLDFDGIEDFDPETAEIAIQKQLSEGIDEFREAALDAHERVSDLKEEASEEMPETDRSTNSRNPTAVSTMPTQDRRDLGSLPRFSTVPQQTRHSGAPNRRRLYGNRFDQETGGEKE